MEAARGEVGEEERTVAPVHRPEPGAFALGHRIERSSEPMRIGTHEWRLTLYWGWGCDVVDGRLVESERPLVGYEWRRIGPWSDGLWRRDVDWPRYDSHNGETAGLPRSLRRLWARCPWAHRDAIEELLRGRQGR